MIEQISQENEQFIEAAVAAGTFQDRAQALNQAVELLRKRAALLAQVNEGIADIEAGNYTDYDEAGLKARFDQLKNRMKSRVNVQPHQVGGKGGGEFEG